MYEITVEGRFTAAHHHRTPLHDGALHGHDFLVLVCLAGPVLEDDVLVDFHAIELELQQTLLALGHQDLSRHPDFTAREATPAALARWIHDRLRDRVASTRARLASVEVRDGEWTGARYEPGDPPAGRTTPS